MTNLSLFKEEELGAGIQDLGGRAFGGEPDALLLTPLREYLELLLSAAMFPVNEVAPDSPTAPYLGARFGAALNVADRNRTARICTGPVSRANRCAFHFGRSRVLGCGVFQL